MERVQDRLHDTIRVSQHVVVPEAQDEIAHGFQDRGSCPVLFGPLRVLPAIELHDHASICANKIDHVAIDRRLPTKLPTGEAAVAQTEPQHAFRVGLVAAQASGYADLASHALPPSPQPSPRWGEGARRVRACSMRCSSGENAGKPACSTSPRWGEVGARSAPGEGARAYRESLAPSP